MKRLLTFGCMAALLSSTALFAAEATTLESLTVMALGPVDGRAVVKTADGKMQVLKIGDTLPGTKAVVTQVLIDKLVVEDTIGKPGEAPVKQTVWIYKPDKAGAKSRVQRLDREGPPKAAVEKPVIQKGREKK